jgi:hypothetical protein
LGTQLGVPTINLGTDGMAAGYAERRQAGRVLCVVAAAGSGP